MLEVERGGCKVLKQATAEVEGQVPLRKGRERQQAQRHHGGRTGGADVPPEAPLVGTSARVKDEFPRADRSPLQGALTELGHGFHRLQVLGTESWGVTSGTDIGQMQHLAGQGR
jgi:hypothetical protein